MTLPIRSMTGFARVQKTTEHGDITVSLKSVNHRGLDLHFHREGNCFTQGFTKGSDKNCSSWSRW